MQTLSLTTLFVTLFGTSFTPAPEEKKDSEKIQGEWEIVAAEQQGTDRSSFVQNFSPTMVIEGTKYTFTAGNNIERGEIKLDPKAKIPTLDQDIQEGIQKGKTQLGIYKFEGDTLKICLSEEGGTTRPSSFKTVAEGPEYVMFTLKRKKKE